MIPEKKRILITVRAYPQPSGQYAETSCVAGVDLEGKKTIRLYPVPARSLPDDHKFTKYSIIEANVVKARGDARPESHNIDLDSIRVIEKVDTRRHWSQRDDLVEPFRIARSVEELRAMFERERKTAILPSLALLRPREVLDFVMERKKETNWSVEELEKLNGAGQQSFFGLPGFGGQVVKVPLQFVPYTFKYKFLCDDPSCNQPHEFQVFDWEITESYRQWRGKYREDEWEGKFREKYEERFVRSGKIDLQFYLGTIKNHPQQWTIIGLYYPTRPS